MGSVHNTIVKSGLKKPKNLTLVLRGRQGVGFNLTPDENYDLQNKRFTNIRDPKDVNDAIPRSFLESAVNGVINRMSQQGVGVKLTSDENYDLQKKGLTNVHDTKDLNDAVTRSFLESALDDVNKRMCLELSAAISILDSRISELEHHRAKRL